METDVKVGLTDTTCVKQDAVCQSGISASCVADYKAVRVVISSLAQVLFFFPLVHG